MPNLSRVNVIEYYNRLLNQIYLSIKNEKEMLISAINEMEQMKKELFKHEPPKYMFIKYKKWKTNLSFLDEKLFTFYSYLGENVDEYYNLSNMLINE